MVDHKRPLRVDDEVVLHARQAEIAGWLGGGVDVARRRRKDFDDDHRLRHFEGIGRYFAAMHESIQLVRGLPVDPYRHAVGQHLARQVRAADRLCQPAVCISNLTRACRARSGAVA